jgi:hypothetical protein
MRPYWLALAGLALLTACVRDPERARHSVDEYRADAELRHAEVQRCEKDPGALRKSPDCVNAQTAASFEDRLRLRDAPPVGLDNSKGSTE